MRRSIIRTLFLMLILAVGFIAGQLSAAQPHMQAALTNLRQARTNLVRASPDKGGHRERAIELVDDAIKEVEKGIGWDRRH